MLDIRQDALAFVLHAHDTDAFEPKTARLTTTTFDYLGYDTFPANQHPEIARNRCR
jgi:hypothetical protein